MAVSRTHRYTIDPAGLHELIASHDTATPEETTVELHYSDGIAAARTTLALEANAAALQRRLPDGWELAPYEGEDLRGRALLGANLLVPFHEVCAARTRDGQPAAGQPQLSYIAFVSQAHMRRRRVRQAAATHASAPGSLRTERTR
jgi:hypothetical protein